MLELSPSLMLIVLLLFIGLIAYLNKALYQPIINFMDQRDRTISASAEESQNLSSDVDELKSETAAILDSAKQEAIALKQSALDEAKSEAEKLVNSKEAELNKAYEEFSKKLEDEKEELKNKILSEVPLIKEALKAKFSQAL